ncbi:MAG: hypothetical protein FWG18_02985, partial [Alphaproteobacteria bacterium]|nr:hypothetical protein [Alphaproteobacteria bacterium]
MFKKLYESLNILTGQLNALNQMAHITPIFITKKIHLNSRGDIWTMPTGIRMHVPQYPWDYIQEIIVDSDNFFELDILEKCAEWIPPNAVILDLGANIGNHSIYWASIGGAKRVHAFEPLRPSYE